MTDLPALQGEIASANASEIGLRLSAPERERLRRPRPVDPVAFEACLTGSYEWKKLTPAGLEAARHAFGKSLLAADPSFAPAHQGLAWVWLARQQIGLVPPAEAVPRANGAALEAVRRRRRNARLAGAWGPRA